MTPVTSQRGDDRPTQQAPALEEIVRPFGSEQTVAMIDRDGLRVTMTYDELARRTAGAAARLRALGVAPGAPVAMVLANDLDTVSAALGVWACGATLVSLPPAPRRDSGLHAGRFAKVLTAMGCDTLLTGPDEAPILADARQLPVRGLSDEPTTRLPDIEIPGTALVQFTSGSLGAPKGVAISRTALAGHVKMISDHFALDPARDAIGSWLPLYHDLGLVCFFLPGLCSRIRQVQYQPMNFLFDPGSWMRMLSEERATVTGAPNFAFRLAARAPVPAGLDLRHVRLVLNAAERIRWQDIEDLLQACEPAGLTWPAVLPAYGLAEATVGVSSIRLADAPRRGRDGHVSLGRPLPGTGVTEQDGSISVSGDWLFDGYFTENGFEPRTEPAFDTQDAGFIDQGEVYVLGRRTEVLSLGGRNVFAEDVEAVAFHALGAAGYACAAFKSQALDRFGLAVELNPHSDAAALGQRVLTSVAETLGTRPAPLIMLRRGAIPRTSSGKVRRAVLRQAYESGEIPRHKILAELA